MKKTTKIAKNKIKTMELVQIYLNLFNKISIFLQISLHLFCCNFSISLLDPDPHQYLEVIGSKRYLIPGCKEGLHHGGEGTLAELEGDSTASVHHEVKIPVLPKTGITNQ